MHVPGNIIYAQNQGSPTITFWSEVFTRTRSPAVAGSARRPFTGIWGRPQPPKRGTPWEVIGARAKNLAVSHGLAYYDPANSHLWRMMFIGMGLFKLGVFSAARSYRFYVWIAVIGLLIGIPLNSYTAWLALQTNFDRVTFAFTHIAYDIERLPAALADMALLMLLCKAGALRWLTSRLAAIGRMALSNYILHSVVCTFVFTGYGFGIGISKLYATPFRTEANTRTSINGREKL
jgi:hypothetical protein